MQFHNLKKNRTNRKAKKIGRGGKRGKTSGRGTKGQNARAGRKKRPEMRDIIKKLPKLRGRGKNFLKSRLEKAMPIKLSILDKNFSAGDKINHQVLLEKGIINKKNGRIPKAKILADKEIKKNFIFENIETSKKVKNLSK
ncbi:MAG: uL15 family ribosomal protein [Candidatus Zambryskibacteria bacterium]|nr:uL15 family ribosomal protein [Candidatus Zambryskibacteria bacterium]